MPGRIARSVLGTWILASLLVGGVALGQRAPSASRGVEVVTASPTTLAQPVTTLPPPPTTTTTAPPPPPPAPSAPPAPAPTQQPAPATVAPDPDPVSVPTEPAPADEPLLTDAVGYALRLLRSVVPAPWLAVVPVDITVIAGNTSWSSYGGLIELGDWHLFRDQSRARYVLAHEWGHQAAWRFGPDTYDGEPPTGFPYGGPQPQEQWADCVAEVLTGSSYPSAGLGGCPGAARSFTAAWIAAGPP